jgi:hypothetical protein
LAKIEETFNVADYLGNGAKHLIMFTKLGIFKNYLIKKKHKMCSNFSTIFVNFVKKLRENAKTKTFVSALMQYTKLRLKNVNRECSALGQIKIMTAF